ncbi:tachykinin-like peptides receptor 99D [Littorina saxatilis]|uniref:tachykinin-like peptides receptor 99D n=1 Tax=Littorina saxatilis TaxID=31220 RepID=UPI0038B62A25
MNGTLTMNLTTEAMNLTTEPMPFGNTTEPVPVNLTLPWWQQLFFYIIFVAMFVVAAGGNTIVIWIVLAHKRMRTVTNYFLINLAVADVMISLLNTPFNFLYNMYQDWWFDRAYCKFSSFISTCTISASVLTFMAIAIDRYIAIIHPLRPRLTGRIVLTIIVGIWLASILLALPNIIYSEVYTWNESGRTMCYMHWPDIQLSHQSDQDLIYSTVLMVLNYFLPMVILTVTYSRISWELWVSRTIGEAVSMQAERIRSKRKVVKMMVAVVMIFGFCWLPYHSFFIAVQVDETIRHKPYTQQVYLLIFWLAMSNSLYNPIIYCLMNARFRQGFLQFFCFCPCPPCRKALRMNQNDRGFYSTRMSMTNTEKLDCNGSLMHTTLESMEDTNSTPTASMYRMHPISQAKITDGNSFDD